MPVLCRLATIQCHWEDRTSIKKMALPDQSMGSPVVYFID